MEDKTNTSLKDKIEELIELNKQTLEKKEKKFKLPWKARLNKGNMRNNYTTVCYINENKAIDFLKVPVQEGTMMVKDAPYLAMADHMLTYKGKPFMIFPAWNTEPFSPKRNLDEAQENKTLNIGYRYLLNRMKSEVIKAKKSINVMLIVGILAAIGLVYYVLKSGGLKL